MKLKNLRTALKFTKNSRSILNMAFITDKGIECTDLQTSILIKDTYGLEKGLHKVETLGDFSKPILEATNEDYPVLNFELKKIVDTVSVNWETLELLSKHSSKDETRLYLSTVVFDINSIVATNGYHLKYIPLVDQKTENTYLIPRESIELLVKFCKSFKIKEELKIEFDENFANIETDSFVFNIRLITREFLKWRAILPKKTAHKFEVSNWVDLKELKPYLDKRSPKCLITGLNNEVFFIVPNTDIKIKIGSCKNDFTIGFNPLFLDIASEGKKEFTIKYNNELSPAVVNDCIVMPLKT